MAVIISSTISRLTENGTQTYKGYNLQGHS